MLLASIVAFWPPRVDALSPLSVIFGVLFGFLIVAYVLGYRDYCSWHALGPGGPPHSVWGWVLVHRLGLRRLRDIKSTSRYDALMKDCPDEARSYLPSSSLQPLECGSDTWMIDTLPARHGPAPTISRWIAPVRQLTQEADEKTKEVITG
jgi:hypothetical protein